MNFKTRPVKLAGVSALFILYACVSYAHTKDLTPGNPDFQVNTDFLRSEVVPDPSNLRLKEGKKSPPETVFIVDKFEYTVKNNRPNAVTVTESFLGYYDTSVTVPDSVEWGGQTYVVTGVADSVFAYYKLKQIFLPETIENIGEKAFYYCDQLETIHLPSGLTSIKASTFEFCRSLAHIELPAGIKSIRDKAFKDCQSLQSMVLPDLLQTLGKDAFQNCSSMEAFTITQSNSFFSTFQGILYNKFQTRLILAPMTVEEVTIPEGVTSIADRAFYRCDKLRIINFSKDLVTIGDEAFNGCISLVKLDLPNSLVSIGNNAFEFDRALREIELPESLVSIGNSAFKGCINLTQIRLPEGLETLGESAFSGCERLESVIFPSSLSLLRRGAFSFCDNLKEIVWPEDIVHLDILQNSFSWCGTLEHVDIPARVRVESGAFLSCPSLSSFSVAEDNPYHMAENGMLFNKDRTVLIEYAGTEGKVILPEGIREIGCTLSNRQEMYSLTIPSTVTDIGWDTGCNCLSLFEIICLPLTPPEGKFNLYDYEMSESVHCSIYVPEPSLELYRQTWPRQSIYPIEGSGVESVTGDKSAESYTVYSIDGRLVTVVSDAESLNALPSGIYIVNGKKTVLP